MPQVIRLSQRLWAEYSKQVRRQRRKDAAVRAEVEREELIRSHMPMVVRIAKDCGKSGFLQKVRLEDLIADGNLGLCEAAVRFRPKMGNFEHYAYFRIRGAIVDPNRRQALFERDGHDSLEGIEEDLGYLPPHLDTAAPIRHGSEGTDSPEQALAGAQEGVLSKLWQLPMAQQRVLALRYLMDISPAAIALRLHIPAARVAVLHRQGLASLRKAS